MKFNDRIEEIDLSVDLEVDLTELMVDKHNLDEEGEKQPFFMLKFGTMLTKAKNETLRAKRQLEITEFELAEKIRKNPKTYGLSKDTDTVVFKAIKDLSEYEEAFEEYLETKRKEEDLSIVLETVRDRGYLIKDMLNMWLNQYYDRIELKNDDRRTTKTLFTRRNKKEEEEENNNKPTRTKLKTRIK